MGCKTLNEILTGQRKYGPAMDQEMVTSAKIKCDMQ